MIDYRDIIKSRELRLKLINCLRFIPDKPYLKMVFRIKTGKKLNLKNPETFCDKLNWLKIHNKHPEFTAMADKALARDIVKEKLGEDISIPLLGKWYSYDDIDFDSLPEQFVLKCNHDSASVKVIKDKSKINHEELKKFYTDRLKLNPFVLGREYPYKNIVPCIIAEKFMEDFENGELIDYKFFCFNGVPKIMFVATDRASDCRFDFYDMDFNHLDIVNIHPNSDGHINKPEHFEEMVSYAEKLSEDTKFVRIDFYEINGKVYFGEYTFFHGGGFWRMAPTEWEYKLGEWINLNS